MDDFAKDTNVPANDCIFRQAAIDAICKHGTELERRGITVLSIVNHKQTTVDLLESLPSAQPEITDAQAIEHLQDSGWMQNHDKQMYEMGLRENLSDDGDSYDALLPSAQPERKRGKWTKKDVIYITEAKDVIDAWQSCKCSACGRYDTRPYMYYFSEPRFCSYCGAEMERRDDGNNSIDRPDYR